MNRPSKFFFFFYIDSTTEMVHWHKHTTKSRSFNARNFKVYGSCFKIPRLIHQKSQRTKSELTPQFDKIRLYLSIICRTCGQTSCVVGMPRHPFIITGSPFEICSSTLSNVIKLSGS